MTIRLDGWRKYILIAPMLFLVFSAVFFSRANKEIKQSLMQEKYYEIIHAVDMLGAAVEANPDRPWGDHERNIVDSVEYLDGLEQVYAAAYEPTDSGLALITDRTFETSIFEPFDYSEFVEMIGEKESGTITIGYTPEHQSYRELYIYFRWMPVYSAPHSRYLVVAGVSEHSIIVKVGAWVSMGQAVHMAATFLLNEALVAVFVVLGDVWPQRAGDKWLKGGGSSNV